MLTNARFIAACYGTPAAAREHPGRIDLSQLRAGHHGLLGRHGPAAAGHRCSKTSTAGCPPLFGEKVLPLVRRGADPGPGAPPRGEVQADQRVRVHDASTRSARRWAWKPTPQPAKPGADSIFVDAKDIPIELAGTVDPNLHPTLAGEERSRPRTARRPTPAEDAEKPAKPESNNRNGDMNMEAQALRPRTSRRTTSRAPSRAGPPPSATWTTATTSSCPARSPRSIKARKPKMLWQHKSRPAHRRLGRGDARRPRGCYVKGRILDTRARQRRLHAGQGRGDRRA